LEYKVNPDSEVGNFVKTLTYILGKNVNGSRSRSSDLDLTNFKGEFRVHGVPYTSAERGIIEPSPEGLRDRRKYIPSPAGRHTLENLVMIRSLIIAPISS
jgi:hypothetical protein